MNIETPLLGFCAWGSGIGKTTLLTSIIPILMSHGLKISVIKHAHHSFDIDHPGKDSYRLRQAGAVQMLLGSRKRWALMTEIASIDPKASEPELKDLLKHIDGSLVDLIVVEGFKSAPIPKIEIFRPALGKPLLADTDKQIIAIAVDCEMQSDLPVLNLNDPNNVANFIISWLRKERLRRKQQ